MVLSAIPCLSDDQWLWLPTVICGGCYRELENLKENSLHVLKHMDYLSLDPPVVQHSMVTRTRLEQGEGSVVMKCCCSVCSVGRLKAGQYLHHLVTVSESAGRPRQKDSPVKPGPMTICVVCRSSYGPGYQHVCSRAAKRESLEELIRNTSQKTKHRVLASQLKEVFHDQGVSTQGGTISLSSGGKCPLQASLGKTQTKPKFSNIIMNRLQSKIGVSDKKMNIIGNFLRAGCGRSSVVNLQKQMTERNKKLADHFETKVLQQQKYVTEDSDENESKKKKKKKVKVNVEKPAVITKNVDELAAFVMEERNLSPETSEIQIGIDDGQNLVKVMMTIKDKDKLEPDKKKMKYSEGFGVKDFKLSGVKKLIILFASPTCETYENLSTILKVLKLEALDFGFTCDLKLVLILCGKQCAASKHCCPFCEGCSPWLTETSPITIGSLWASYGSFIAAGSNLKLAQRFKNVVNPPLIIGPNDCKVLGLVYFPELHVLTGIVGKLVKELERKVFSSPEAGKKFLDDWMASPLVNVARTVYHGSANFVGDMARLLLKKVGHLEEAISMLDDGTILKAAPFIKAFKQFEEVRKACFGQHVEKDYALKIKVFMVTYRSLEISIPLKVGFRFKHRYLSFCT